jgi:hypothetical protein
LAITVKFRLSMRCALRGSAVLIPKKGLVGFGVYDLFMLS